LWPSDDDPADSLATAVAKMLEDWNPEATPHPVRAYHPFPEMKGGLMLNSCTKSSSQTKFTFHFLVFLPPPSQENFPHSMYSPKSARADILGRSQQLKCHVLVSIFLFCSEWRSPTVRLSSFIIRPFLSNFNTCFPLWFSSRVVIT